MLSKILFSLHFFSTWLDNKGRFRSSFEPTISFCFVSTTVLNYTSTLGSITNLNLMEALRDGFVIFEIVLYHIFVKCRRVSYWLVADDVYFLLYVLVVFCVLYCSWMSSSIRRNQSRAQIFIDYTFQNTKQFMFIRYSSLLRKLSCFKKSSLISMLSFMSQCICFHTCFPANALIRFQLWP